MSEVTNVCLETSHISRYDTKIAYGLTAVGHCSKWKGVDVDCFESDSRVLLSGQAKLLYLKKLLNYLFEVQKDIYALTAQVKHYFVLAQMLRFEKNVPVFLLSDEYGNLL